MKAFILIVVSVVGLVLVIRGFLKNFKDIRNKPKKEHTAVDYAFNYPVFFLWYGFLCIFCVGLVVNNLILK